MKNKSKGLNNPNLYTPNTDYTGADSFSIYCCDLEGDDSLCSNEFSVNINIQDKNDQPIFSNCEDVDTDGDETFDLIDAFPIDPTQHNSFYHYVTNYYINNFGMNPDRALLINCRKIPTHDSVNVEELFPDSRMDLSLRYRDAESGLEEKQKKTNYGWLDPT